MENVTTRTSNPFGMRAPRYVRDGERTAVYGYGDANADFHLVGDYPGVHGGVATGVPFTGTDAGRRLMQVMHDVGFVDDPASDRPTLSNLYASYVHASVTPGGRRPTEKEYDDLERFFDAELRAINAHILLPVDDHATWHVLREYTTQERKFDPGDDLHARQIRGRGFLVVPVRDPADWDDADEADLRATLEAILDSDYRQTKGVATLVG
ncbi:uracil-DNA glycosylase family protein [Halobacteriaceae archaeon GCM10025711]